MTRPRRARRHDGPRPIVLVGFDGLQLLDLAGPLEVFTTADQVAGGGAYDVRLATPGGQPVRTSSGVELSAEVALGEVASRLGSVDTVLVVGGTGSRTIRNDPAFLDPLRTVAQDADRMASVCIGALVLAAAGLLDGYRATTHWASCAHLAQRHPAVEALRVEAARRLLETTDHGVAGIARTVGLGHAETLHRASAGGWAPHPTATASTSPAPDPDHQPQLKELPCRSPSASTRA